VGFEPTLRFPVNTLSKRAPSATRPPLHCVATKAHAYLVLKTRAKGALCAFSHSATPPHCVAIEGGRTIVPATGLTSHCRTIRFADAFQHLGALATHPRGRFRPSAALANRLGRPHCQRQMADPFDDYLLRPDPRDPRLTERVRGIDQTGAPIETAVVVERALTIFLNGQEIVTAMTINDYPDYLALGYLLNQNMLQPQDIVTGVDYDEELAVVVVRTERATDYEQKLKKKVQTSGCAQGTVFGDLMEVIENAQLPPAELRTSWLYGLTAKINITPSLYLEAGAIHGCVLAQRDRPLVYMEDVGRHNAVDKIAGWMFRERVTAGDKIFYTTGRLTSEMVIKTVRMGIPILVSRSGFTAWGVELARKANLTLIGRARGKRFVALAGEDRIVFDQDLAYVAEESAKHRRKAAMHDD
jgi:FdhD protein